MGGYEEERKETIMFVFKQRYTKCGVTKQTKKWYIRFRDHLDRLQTIPAFTGKGVSEELGRKLDRD